MVLKKSHIFIFLALLFFIRCDTDKECFVSSTSDVRAKFYSFSNSMINEEVANELSIYGISHKDSLLYNNDVQVYEIYLPLAPNQVNVQFVIQIKEDIDTLLFDYTPELNYYDDACGFIMNYKLKNVDYTTNRIDSISIINPEVTPENEVHLRIFI